MSVISKLAQLILQGRNTELDFASSHPIEVQEKQQKYLLNELSRCNYGKEHGFGNNLAYSEFKSKIPINTYDSLLPYITRVMQGEQNLLWTSKIKWYAKSSGTTATTSKYIPTSKEMLQLSHFRGVRDVAAYYYRLYPNGGCLDGLTLTLGGTITPNPMGGEGFAGDLSGILIENQPYIGSFKRTPAKKFALMNDFEQKIDYIVKNCSKENVTSFAGVPVWYMVLANKILDYTGKSDMCEIWPNICFFAHGGTSFTPYKEQFKRLFPSEKMKYMETYNASEGFFAIADDPTRSDMLLMTDYGTFYEFLATSDLDTPSNAVPLEGVKVGVNYAIIITTCSGLWRYMIGDTVEFTSVLPYRIRITGRTKNYINMAGEEVIIDNAQKAFERACLETGSEIVEFTAAPHYMEGSQTGYHQWIVEFEREPESLEKFVEIFDTTLQDVNSDYSVKRCKNMALMPPKFIVAPKGTFYNWTKTQGRLGSQAKIPRLANHRKYVEELLLMIGL